jgi:hypothetical protein
LKSPHVTRHKPILEIPVRQFDFFIDAPQQGLDPLAIIPDTLEDYIQSRSRREWAALGRIFAKLS